MNSTVTDILQILNDAQSLRAVGFSSGYTFNISGAEELFDEIMQNTACELPIFSGILMLEENETKANFTIIDGLQRITTICLLLTALCDSIKNSSQKNNIAREKIVTRYLMFQNSAKLKLTDKDNSIYNKIISGLQITDENEKNTNLYKVYSFFTEKIKANTISYNSLFKIIANVQFMTVFIPKSNIPLRELYQSINGKKDDMTQVKLISDYINQISKEASEIWNCAIKKYEADGLGSILKYYLRDFLIIENNGSFSDDLYKSFSIYCKKMLNYIEITQITEKMKKYSEYYLKILKSDFEDSEIQSQFVMLNENNGQDAYPYLMKIIDDFENNQISKKVFLELMNVINEFFASRIKNSDLKTEFSSICPELNGLIAQRSTSPNETIEIDLSKMKYVENDTNRMEKKLNKKLTINEITQMSTFEV